MKKLSIFAALLALMMVGCAENQLDNIEANESAVVEPTDLTAGFADEEQTKTYVENGKYLRWHEADLITAFFGNTLNRQYKFKGKTGDNSGTFKLVPDGELGTGNALEAIYALYPYNEDATISDEGVMNITLPATQTYAEDSFGKGANTMIAVTAGVEDTFLGFKNVCGYLKLKLYNESGATLKSVEVKGNNGEKIAGSATAAMEFGGVPTVTMSADATTSVTLDCGEGVVLGTSAEEATELWIVLPETTFEGGITITATDTEGGSFEKSTTKSVAITRNEIQPMATLGAEFVVPIPETWKIYYTATAKVTPYKTDVFGANYVSNEWDETTGNGVIIFDGEVTQFGDYAFYYCESLASITIPEGVTSIGKYIFYGCSSLMEFNGKCASEDGKSLIVDGVLSSFARGCGLTEYTIPEGVTSIGLGVFENCSDLVSITMPNSVTSIGDWAFNRCSSLASITIDGVVSIGERALSMCSSLQSVTIPSVTYIGDSAFMDCKNLESVTIGKGASSIGAHAFNGCSNLAEVYCKATTPPSGDYAMFDYNASGRKIYVPRASVEAYKEARYWRNYADYIVRYEFEDGEVVYPETQKIYYTSSDGNIMEPRYEGVDIFDANIVSNTYKNGQGVITFDREVTKIGEEAFYNCMRLVSITIPEGVTSIGEQAFSLCYSLTSVTIPEGVTSIGYSTFSECSSLTSITIRAGVTSIGNYAFSGCKSLASIIIPEGVTSIGNYAFQYCSSLTSITIPEDVTSIGERAFYRCSSLTSISIPDGVTSIGNSAFEDCTLLTSVYCKPTTPPMGGNIMFANNASERKIYVPAESVEAYKTATYWSQFANVIIAYDFEKGEVVGPTPKPNPENCEVVITYLAPSDEMEFYDWLNDLDAFAYDVSRMGGGASYPFHPSNDYQTFTIWFGYELTTITFMKDFHTYPFTSYETNATLTLPASVTSIVVESGATRIFERLYIKATTPPALNNGNHPWGLGSEIYVPTESVDAYKNAEVWRDYANIIKGYDFE